MEAKADGMEKLFESCGGHPELAKFYLGVDSGLFRHVADASAKAVVDMRPQITQWNTGPSSATGGSSQTLVDLVQGVVPLYEQVSQHLSSKPNSDKS